MITIVALCLLFGMFAGTLAGLFGVGGGVIFVPALMFCFDLLKIPQDIYMHLVIGTSLSCILVTTINSSYSQFKRGNIDWIVFRKLAFGVIIGVFLGGRIAEMLASQTLKLLFALFMALLTVKMWTGYKVDPKERNISLLWYWIVGAVIGFKSAILGIGGGTLSVPFLSWTGKKMKQAVGVSSSLGVIISFIGTITYIYTGYDNTNLPPFSVGYVYIPAFLGIASMSAIFAHVGAKLSDRMDHARLYKAFSIFIALIMVKTFYSVVVHWN